MSSTVIDYAPLSQRPTKAEKDSARSEARSGTLGKVTATMARNSTRDGVFVTVGIGGFLTLIIGIVAIVQWAQDDDPYIGGIATAFVAALCVVIYLIGRLVGRRTWRRTVQLIAFARCSPTT